MDFFLVVLLAIVFGLKLSSLRGRNEQLSRRIADLHLEISAVRQAFLARIRKLEEGGVKAPPTQTQEAPTAIETVETAFVEPTPPSVPETPTIGKSIGSILGT